MSEIMKAFSSRLSRRTFLAGLGATAALPILAACQPEIVEVEKIVEKEVTRIVEKPVEIEKEVIREVEVEKRGVRGPIRMAAWGADHFRKAIEPIAVKTGILLNVFEYPGEFNTKLMAEVAAGVAPDIMLFDSFWMGDFFARDVTVDFLTYLKAFNIGPEHENWAVDLMLDGGFKGKLEGLPFSAPRAMGVFVNGGMADAEGIGRSDLPLWGQENYDSWTLPDMIELAESLSKVTSDGRVEQYGWDTLMANIKWNLTDVHMQHVMSNEGWFWEDPWSYEPEEMTCTTPEVTEGLDWVYPLQDKKIIPDPSVSASIGGHQTFIGKHAASLTFPMVAGFHQGDEFKDVEVRTFYLPYTKKRVQQYQSNLMCVNKESKFKDETAEWIIEFVTDDEMNRIKLYNDIPVWNPAKWIGELDSGQFKDTLLMSISHLAGHSTVPRLAEDVNAVPRHFTLKGAFVRSTLGSGWERYLLGKQSLKEAWGEAKTEIDAELAKGYDY
jgi:ABC-type glycerol-3-phosphate transport system substrate-binding protein